MQRYVIFVFSFALFFSACTSDSTNADSADTAKKESAEADYVQNPLLDTQEGQFLLRNFWVFEFYIIPNDHEASVENRGRWLAFSPDGTFECGHWEKKTSQGTWRLYNDGKVKVLLDAEDDKEDAEWELQFAADGDVSSWIGTDAFTNNKGVMAKVINLMTRPTKKQFGYE